MAAALAGILLCVALIGATPAADAGNRAPNIILITTDDQPLSTFDREYMPKTFRRLVDHGTSFSDAVVNSPVCCPSRAILLSGQYPHNNGVFTNSPGYGDLREPRNVLPVWLNRAGYRTAHFGKWLHGYEKLHGTDPAPGWDRWLSQLKRRSYYDYKLSRDGKKVSKGSRPADHVTNVMTRSASRFVEKQSKKRGPFFLQLDYYAPHVGSRTKKKGERGRCNGAPDPGPREQGTIRDGGAPRTPAFNEADIGDKPYFAQTNKLGKRRLTGLDRRYRCTLESVIGVDRGINKVFKKVKKSGELDDTAFVFMTDNGYFFGEHRIADGKVRPWEESIRTPLVLRLPPEWRATEREVTEQVAEIDVVPTILHLAGAESCRGSDCRVLDGRSLIAATRGKTEAFADRAVLVEFDDPIQEPRTFACRFTSLRTAADVLIENSSYPDPQTGLCEEGLLYEHYSIDQDPYQLENRIGPEGLPASARQIELQGRLDALRECSGIEGRDPASPGGYCG